VELLRSAGECRITSHAAAHAAAEPYTRNNGVTTWKVELFQPVLGAATPQYYGARVTVTITFQTVLLGIVPAYDTLTITQDAEAIAVTAL
jgi:hypothetical protein